MLTFPVANMMSTFRLGFFVICYNLLAVDGMKQKSMSGDFQVQQEISWQQGQEDFRKTDDLLAPEQQWPGVRLERRYESDFSLDLDLSNTEEDSQNALPIGTTEPNAIAANNENCPPLPSGEKSRAGGGKERRAPPPGPPGTNSVCPHSATTDTDKPESGQQQQQQPPTTGNGGDERQGGQAPGGTPQGQPLVFPKLFRIPINDGDSPACYDATHGVLPIGVCQNPQRSPEPSKYDVLMNRNVDIFPRAWKLIDSDPAWPGMRECPPSRKDNGIWCCKFYSYLYRWADICWPLAAIDRMNSKGIGDWQNQQFNDPLILPP